MNTSRPRHVCKHLHERNACPFAGDGTPENPPCEHYDSREPVLRAFGPASNSAFAAELARTNPAAYAALRQQAVARGLLAPTLRDRAAALKEQQQ